MLYPQSIGDAVYLALSCAFVIFAAVKLARRKERRVGRWAAFAFLFSPALYILALLPKRRQMDATISLQPCAACQAAISTEARACPHCGHPTRKRKTWRQRLATLGVGIGLALPAIQICSLLIIYFYGSLGGMPGCEGGYAKWEIGAYLARGSAGSTSGANLLELTHIETTMFRTDRVECHAIARLDTGEETPIVYAFFKDKDRIMIQAQLMDGYSDD